MSTRPDIDIQSDTRTVRIDGAPVTLGARAFDVLAYLSANMGRVVTKQELLEKVWGGLAVEEGNLAVQISALRKALGPNAISTVPGVGYQLAAASGPAPLGLAETAPPLPDMPSLAVLPLANLTGSADNDYFVDGMVAELSAALSRVSGLFVIAATSSLRYKGQAIDLPAVGRELGVRYLLEGAIQQAVTQLRVTVQLVEAETGRTIWSDRITGDTSDLFQLQDDLAGRVASAVEPKLIYAEAIRTASAPTESLQAYDLMLRAIPGLIKIPDLNSFEASVALLNRAIELDPDFALAKAWKCRAYMQARGARIISFERSKDVMELGQALIAEDHEDPLVLAFAGVTHAFFSEDKEPGAMAARRAVARNPNSGITLTAAGWALSYVEDYDTAIRSFEAAMRFDPFGQDNALCLAGYGACLMFTDRLDEAIEALETGRARKPGFGAVIQWLTMAYWAAGREDDARATASELRRLVPDLGIAMTLKSTPHCRPKQLALLKAAFEGVGIPD